MSTGNPGSQNTPGGNSEPVGGSPGSGCAPSTGVNAICDCLGCSISRIAKATEGILAEMAKKTNEACDIKDDCIDKILNKLKQKIEGPAYSAEKCRMMAMQGMVGTLEYAVRCANQASDKCDTICTLGDPTTEGKCCPNCGAEKCVCKDGQCVKVEQKKEGFDAWCNKQTGDTAITIHGEPAPPGMAHLGFSETQQGAVALLVNCQRPEPGGGGGGSPSGGRQPVSLPPVSLPYCDLGSLVDGRILANSADAIRGFYEAGGILSVIDAWSDVGLAGIQLSDVGATIAAVGRVIAGAPSVMAQAAATNLPPLVGCDNPYFEQTLKLFGTMQAFERQSGVSFQEWMMPYKYAMHAACPQLHLSPSDSMKAFLSNAIDGTTMNMLWKINGYCPEDVAWARHSSKSRPVPIQLAMMKRRKLIDDTGYHTGMRELGYLEHDVRSRLFDLTEQVPTLTDITRLMVRDADDEEIAARFGLDSEFDKKYGGQLREWSEFQGIPEKFAKYYWRAHWSIPSPGQLFTFYHRLRNNPKFGGKDKLLDDIKAALIQQDILPFWHDHYLAVSFKPLTRIDVRRAFEIGALQESDVTQSYTDLGYSDENAERLTRFSVKLRDKGIVNHRLIKLWLKFGISRSDAEARMVNDGLPQDKVSQAFDEASIQFINSSYAQAYVRGDLTKDNFTARLDNHGVKLDTIQSIVDQLSVKLQDHPALKDYAAGVLDYSEAESEMVLAGVLPETAMARLHEVDRDVDRSLIVACQRGIKRRFLMGELTQQEAITELQSRGTTAARATKLANWWGCELQSGRREISASKLCDLLGKGAINAPDYLSRLHRIGYSDVDASLMLEDCLSTVSMKRLAQAKKDAKEQAASQDRIARALAQQAKQTFNANQQLKAARQKAARLKAAREKILISTAEKLTPKCECDTHTALVAVRNEVARLRQQFELSEDQALQVTAVAAGEFAGPELSEYTILCTLFAEEMVNANLSGIPAEIQLPESSNGFTQPSG